jgi:probable rRNA maturation factor
MNKIDLIIDSEGAGDLDFSSLQDLHKIIQEVVYPSCKNNWVVSLKFVDINEMQLINKTYRNIDRPTNVLSFPNDLSGSVQGSFLGDIAVCPELILKESQEQEKSAQDHLSHLYVHGVLHLLGYDHEEDDSADDMENLEKNILSKIDVADPY